MPYEFRNLTLPLAMLGGSVQSPVRSSQVSPVNPCAQVHVKASTPFEHVPPFWHGVDSQRLRYNSHNRPVRPGLHTQEKLPVCSKHVAPFLHGFESQIVALHKFPVQEGTLKKRLTLSIVKHTNIQWNYFFTTAGSLLHLLKHQFTLFTLTRKMLSR